MPMGRPSDYTPELAAQICGKIAEGLSLRTICSADDMPDKSNVFRWLANNEIFRDQYEKATSARSDALVEEILDISDDKRSDVQRAKLMVDTRKWIASRLKPKKYGDKVSTEVSGLDGGSIDIKSSGIEASIDRAIASITRAKTDSDKQKT